MKVVLLCLPLFFCGAIPFSYLLGKLLLHKDIRDFGDGNPGAANAWKAGGAAVGLVAILLDVLKGLIPLLLVLSLFDMEGISMAFLAVAPVCGHAFSPFLHFRGGKAVAVTYGVWLALTGLAGPLAMAITSAVFVLIQSVDAWTVMAAMAGLFTYLLYTEAEQPFLVTCVLNSAIVFYKHRQDLKGFMKLRPQFAAILRRDGHGTSG
jgi:glycerol-3-phosphate acyltransferase PlsY